MNRAQAPAYVLLLSACASAPACGLNQAGVDPLENTIAYPGERGDGQGGRLAVRHQLERRPPLQRRHADRAQPGRAATDRHTSGATAVTGPDWACPEVELRQPASQRTRRRLLLPRRAGPQPPQLRRAPVRRPAADQGDGTYNVRIGSFAAGMVAAAAVLPDTIRNTAARCVTHLQHVRARSTIVC